MTNADDHSLAQRFADFSLAFENGAPMYSRIAHRVASQPEVLELMSVAPPTQRIPVLLFASVHHILLANRDQPLAQHYPNIATREAHGHVEDSFIDFVLTHRDEIAERLAARSTQTNEIGRCSWFLFPFTMIGREMGAISHIDVGSSAGLNLLFPDLAFDMGLGHVIGDRAGITIEFEILGRPPLPDSVPSITSSIGLDANPIDVWNEVEVQWLEACVWPEQVERFTRLERAIGLARTRGLTVRRGDAVVDVARCVADAKEHGHPVITTSWVMNYLSPRSRVDFVHELDRIGAETDLSWVIAESPRETPGLPVDAHPDEDITVISLVTWRGGRRESRRLATTHPHGNWVNWGA